MHRVEARPSGQSQPPGQATAVTDAIVCEGICRAYYTGRKERAPLVALQNVDLTVADGEFISILGPSGCGKTTLLNIMAGIDSANRGTVSFASSITRKAYLFQRDTLLPWRTAVRNVEIGMSTLSRRERRARAEQWLKLVGLEGFEDSYPSRLSGGMRRRVALATVFAHEPQVLFMDEPFGSVDAQTRLQLQSELLKLWESERRTVIFVTHDIEEALLLSDRVVVMRGKPGRIIADFRVDAPRPRTADGIRRDPTARTLTERIWRELAAGPAGDGG